MFGDGPLTFWEFATREPLPLAVVHDALLEFLRGRKDAVLCGAHAVNAYVVDARMTEDVDLLSPRPRELAEEVRSFLHERYGDDFRIREMKNGIGFSVYQVRKPKSRRLVDVRQISTMPPAKRVRKVLVVTPPELIAAKVVSMVGRWPRPKGYQDQADLYRLLLAFPPLKREEGPVAERIRAAEVGPEVMAAWKELVAQDIQPDDEDGKFTGLPQSR